MSNIAKQFIVIGGLYSLLVTLTSQCTDGVASCISCNDASNCGACDSGYSPSNGLCCPDGLANCPNCDDTGCISCGTGYTGYDHASGCGVCALGYA